MSPCDYCRGRDDEDGETMCDGPKFRNQYGETVCEFFACPEYDLIEEVIIMPKPIPDDELVIIDALCS